MAKVAIKRAQEKCAELADYKRVRKVVVAKEPLVRTEVSKAEALKTFTEKGDEYKCELIRDLEDGTISFYTNGSLP